MIFSRESQIAAESTCDFVVLALVVDSSSKMGTQLAGNGLQLQPCVP